jgi:hypothetical protein
MDAAVTGAITAVHLDDEGAAQRWFALICETYDKTIDAGAAEWPSFTAALLEAASGGGVGADLVEQFVEHLQLTDSTPFETVGRLRELGTDLPAWHRELTAKEPGAESGGYDESAWQAFLAEHGARWDGADSTWDQFREWFVYTATEQGLGEPAAAFVAYAESQPDKVAVFAQYGLSIAGAEAAATDTSTYPRLKEGDTGEWVDYLDTMLTSKGF